MANVFLSYAREDTGVAASLARLLERAGFSVWWDRNIEGGSEYTREIDDALKGADVVTVLWSAHSVGSAWVRDEAASGRDTNRLVPVRLDDAEPPLGFRQYQTIDLSRWNGRDGPALKTLKSAVAAKVGKRADPALGAPPVPGDTAASIPGARRLPLIALVAGLLLVVAAAAYFLLSGPKGGDMPAIAVVSAPSGGDPAGSQALARSLSVEIGALQKGAASAFELRETTGSVPKDVDYLVEVAASRAGSLVAADLALLNRDDRQILWTGHFEKPAAEQADLRPQAALSLQPVLTCLVEASGGGLDLPTLKLYLRGCEKFADGVSGLVDDDQYGLLRQVVDRAPRFAPAIAHLALIEASAERKAEARALVARAKAIDPSLPKIYLAESELNPRSRWHERQAPLIEGLRINPNAAALHSALAFEYAQVGLRNDGIASGARSVELDPASPYVRLGYFQNLTYAGRLAEAEAEIVKAEKIWPTSQNIRDGRWAFDLRVGDARKALEKLKRDQSAGAYGYTGTRIPEASMLEAFLEARINPTPANIDRTIEAYRIKYRREPENSATMLIALAIFDRVDEAYAIVAHPKAMESLANNTNLLFRSYFKSFRQDPRFMPLAARLGLVRYWMDAGRWPDFCFEPDLPYDCKTEAAKLKSAGQMH